MIGTPRTPAFLSSLAPGASTVRLAAFAMAPGSPRPRTAQGPPPEPPPPSGPTTEQLEALRSEAMRQVAHAVEVLRLQAERLAEQARSDALEIGFRVARRILEAELSASPEALFSLVRAALKRAGESRKVLVRVHPQDAKLLAPAMATDGLGVASATVEVVADASLSPGDCVVDTDFGKVDGRLQTRLDELQQAAMAAVEEGAA
jgi:flagellar biosynthesis/type III secretory pathway protein FliH